MSTRTAIKFESIVSVLNAFVEAGDLRVEEKAAWIKYTAKGGCRVYVPKQKLVREVHLAGFGEGWVGTVKPGVHNGNVRAHLDLSSEWALSHLAMMAEHIGPLEPKLTERVRPMGRSTAKPEAVTAAPSGPTPTPSPTPPSLPDAVLKARTFLARVPHMEAACAEKGVPLSALTLARIEEYKAVLAAHSAD